MAAQVGAGAPPHVKGTDGAGGAATSSRPAGRPAGVRLRRPPARLSQGEGGTKGFCPLPSAGGELTKSESAQPSSRVGEPSGVLLLQGALQRSLPLSGSTLAGVSFPGWAPDGRLGSPSGAGEACGAPAAEAGGCAGAESAQSPPSPAVFVVSGSLPLGSIVPSRECALGVGGREGEDAISSPHSTHSGE